MSECGDTCELLVDCRTRALRDFRKVPLSHGRHHGGRLVVGPPRTSLRVESHEEPCVARTLAARADFALMASQPLTIWFTWQGRTLRYTPDFEVHLTAPTEVGRGVRAAFFIVEVKPVSWQMRDGAVWAARAVAVEVASARLGPVFSPRHSYSEAEIAEFEPHLAAYDSVITEGADETDVQLALGVATGQLDTPVDLGDV